MGAEWLLPPAGAVVRVLVDICLSRPLATLPDSPPTPPPEPKGVLTQAQARERLEALLALYWELEQCGDR